MPERPCSAGRCTTDAAEKDKVPESGRNQALEDRVVERRRRVSAFARHLSAVETALSPEAVKAVMDARADGVRKAEEAKRLREATFPADLLAGTGTDPWAVMWEAARRFSEEAAYPGKPFPVTSDASQCVLCQQQLDHAAIHRFQQFQAFAVSKTESELRQLREARPCPVLDSSMLGSGFSDRVRQTGSPCPKTPPVAVVRGSLGTDGHGVPIRAQNRAQAGQRKRAWRLAKPLILLRFSVVERRRIELPTFALRTRRSPS